MWRRVTVNVLVELPEGRRKRGRPTRKFMDVVREDLQRVSLLCLKPHCVLFNLSQKQA